MNNLPDLADEWILSLGQRRCLFRQRFIRYFDQRLEPHLAVMIETGPGRNDVTHDHVFLEPAQIIHASTSGCLGQDTSRVLEGSRAQEAFRLERSLGDAKQHWLSLGG